jgi:hypothetical protein
MNSSFVDWCTKSIKREKVLLVTTLVAVIVVLTIGTNGPHQRGENRFRYLTNEEGMVVKASATGPVIKPVMHTFFEPLKNTTGMDILDHMLMLRIWEEEWQAAGWETKVVTLDDAKNHSLYEAMEKEAERMFPNDSYYRFRLYRYLAVAAAGGGWMCDYDIFPTNFPMDEALNPPFGGKFTSYKNFIPVLIHASADEWTRVAQYFINRMRMPAISKARRPKTDMHMLADLYEGKGSNNLDFKWFTVGSAINTPIDMYIERDRVDCEIMQIGRVIHVSHRGTHVLQLDDKIPSGAQSLAHVAKMMMNDWRKQCGGSNVVA